MSKIKIDKNPTEERLDSMEVKTWPIWTKEISEFPWTYDSQETCFFLEGEVLVTSDDGEEVKVGKGDLVTFPKGMSCKWKVTIPVRKHYTFED